MCPRCPYTGYWHVDMNITGMPVFVARRFDGLAGAIVTFFFWKGVEPEDPSSWHGHLLWHRNQVFRTHCIPLPLHGDGVPVVKGKSLYVISVVSFLSIGTSIYVKMLLTCYWSH